VALARVDVHVSVNIFTLAVDDVLPVEDVVPVEWFVRPKAVGRQSATLAGDRIAGDEL